MTMIMRMLAVMVLMLMAPLAQAQNKVPSERALEAVPKVDDDGKLLVKGHFPTEPLQVYFNLEFIPSDGEWKLIGINVKVGDPK